MLFGDIWGLSGLLLFLLFSDVIESGAFPGILITSEKKNTFKELMWNTCREKKKSNKSALSILLCWQLLKQGADHWISCQQTMNGSTLSNLSEKPETWKPTHFRERIKGCFFRCPCTPNPSARHCSLSLLNTYTAEVPRDLKQVRTSACKVQNWCIILDSPCLIIFFNFKCLSSR